MADSYQGSGQPQAGSPSLFGDPSAGAYRQAPCSQGQDSHQGHGRPGAPRARGFLRAETPEYRQAPSQCGGPVHTMTEGGATVQAVPIFDEGAHPQQAPIAFMIPNPTS